MFDRLKIKNCYLLSCAQQTNLVKMSLCTFMILNEINLFCEVGLTAKARLNHTIYNICKGPGVSL